ncbi:phytanoyl-CoA dioxygenase family protein [Streptomyces sp. NPDC096013]|uniref:phytanoyl-CoA dioxygenase family protein n=1 Tax=Streptomyces sp. NPDC096013 TaxID=3366069 RepID=UPI0037F88DD6
MFDIHPWSRNFRWVAGTACSHIGRERRDEFEERGFFVIEDFFASDEVAAITRETDRCQEAVRRYLSRLPGGRLHSSEEGAITFAQHLVKKSLALRALARDPRLTGIAADLIGPDVNLHWDQAVYKMSDKPQLFPWHQDNGYSFVVPEQYLTVWIALTDTEEDSGCLWMAPGLHKHGVLWHEPLSPIWIQCFDDHPEKVPVPTRAGSLVVFSSLTPHKSGENRSGGTRKAYLVEYAPQGAHLLVGDPHSDVPAKKTPLDNPSWRFPVLRGGKPVEQHSTGPHAPAGLG